MPVPSPSAARPRATALALLAVAAVLVTGCGDGWSPESADALLDRLEETRLVDCTARSSPVEGVAVCEERGGARLTAVLTDDPARVIRTTRAEEGGPWIAGDGWVVVADDGDLERLRAVRDDLGAGSLFLDVDEVPIQVD